MIKHVVKNEKVYLINIEPWDNQPSYHENAHITQQLQLPLPVLDVIEKQK